MSGQDVPYYLRPNKFVERQIFVEALEKLNGSGSLSNYLYASMGGKFLEDFKVVHSRLGLTKMLSIENDETVHERQVYNKPIGFIRCKKCDSSSFISNIESFLEGEDASNCIVWMDYASAKKRQTQLRELESLVGKLVHGDIFKITLNADVRTLVNESDYLDDMDGFQKAAFDKLKRKLQGYFPSDVIDPSMMTDEGISKILCRGIKTAVLNGLRGATSLKALPLVITRYNDGHNMLTLTGIVLEISRDNIFESSAINSFQFFSNDWEHIHHINIPDLSLKERSAIDELIDMGVKPSEIHEKLPFKLHKNPELSLESLSNYLDHYKRYPSFLRVIN